ncbi:hypothetical protein [Niabella beijingensis]|uniref:hypothetical protein n=1 Tax=Niabella beijingensis TaxID=2872700 RepID=UPI001CBA7DCC|nr:hypothetical protein [Niabella beijingensis]MBZ4188862.1 hypothetical protein [Niabella beijingensis]
MKIVLFSLLLFNGNCTTTTTVYICNSKTATKYHHTETCRGLKNCNYRIIQITLDSAKKRNRTLCGWEL